MKALVCEGAHRPLEFKDVPDPTPGPGEVVVAIKAAALNHRDLWIQKGQYAGLKYPIILGSDGCGEVVECGDGVNASWLGRSVIINPALGWGDSAAAQAGDFRILGLPDDGTLAEKVKVAAIQLAPQPAHLDVQHAAALPLAGLTAYRALFSRAGLRAGERVLITGIGGGAALFALQYAIHAGATAFVTSSSDEKIARAVALGAAGGVKYTDADWASALKQQAGGFDVIIDSAGGEGFGQLIDAAAPGGRIAFFGATRGDPPTFPMRKVFWKQLSILGTTMGSPEDFAAMVRFVEQHKITPLADDHVFPLAEGNAAFAAMDASAQFGKIVLTV